MRDYRLNQLNKLQNVEMLRGSHVTADEVLEFGASRVIVATGSRWRRPELARRIRRNGEEDIEEARQQADPIVALQPVPVHVARRDQRVGDGAEPVQRQRAGGVDLLLGLFLAGRIVALVEKRVARGRKDQLRDLFPLSRKYTPARLVLAEFAHRLRADQACFMKIHRRLMNYGEPIAAALFCHLPLHLFW